MLRTNHYVGIIYFNHSLCIFLRTGQMSIFAMKKNKQRRQIKDFIFNRRISRELRFIQLVKSVRNISNRIYKTASKFENEIFKFGCPSSRSLEDAECVHLTLFCKESQRNEDL